MNSAGFVLDGTLHWLLIVYAGLEIIFGVMAVVLCRSHTPAGDKAAFK